MSPYCPHLLESLHKIKKDIQRLVRVGKWKRNFPEFDYDKINARPLKKLDSKNAHPEKDGLETPFIGLGPLVSEITCRERHFWMLRRRIIIE
ncbi:hypothetical protein OUZ56_014644 [Daphnia magna]|uniref:Uncharacterized protein n=1 Tax=Daphnia magna TaxID=35525 RepID=A0ABR0AKG3_9CRUS|nr:hypothetical protein OUZ56_014644 [Daphnia magna]